MGKYSLAAKLADDLGKSTGEALRFIDDVGIDAARKAADDLAAKGSRTVDKWFKRTAAVGGLGGGGALAWKAATVEQAEEIANQEQSHAEAIRSIMESDLAPDAKQELIRQLNQNSPASQNGGGDGDGDGGDDGLLGGDLKVTLVLLIVLVFGLKYSLGGA